MEEAKAIGAVLESYFTIAAIIAGGFWTYWMFIRQRYRYPWLKTDINVSPVQIPNGWILHANVGMENRGAVIAKVAMAELRIRQIVPLPQEVESAIQQGYDPVYEGESEITWPLIAGRNWTESRGPFEVEPKEIDSLHADFFVPSDVTDVEFYFFASNEKKKKSGLGWSSTVIYTLPKRED